MRLPTAAAAAAAATLALAAAPPAAQAKLPSPATMRIVPGSSIGGVKLGMRASTAVKTWGRGGTCAKRIDAVCTWQGTPRQGTALFTVDHHRVTSIRIEVGQRPDDHPAYSGPITKWKTAKGIGIASRLSAVKKAYPRVEPDGSGLTLSSSGRRRTLFESSLHRVASITIAPAE
jgi:hypothetical protein